MASGFIGPDLKGQIQDIALPNDMFFTQRLDSVFSWGTMYFGCSAVDHCGVYIGDGHIMHMTLAGSKIHSVNVLGRNTRVLFVDMNLPEDKRKVPDIQRLKAINSSPLSEEEKRKRAEEPKKWYHRFSAKWQLLYVALRIALNFHHECFRISYIADMVIIAALLDISLYSSLGVAVAWVAVVVAALIIICNQVIWQYRTWRRKPAEPASHPVLGFQGMIFGHYTFYGKLGKFQFGFASYELLFRKFPIRRG